MKVIIAGYGRMGHIIEDILLERGQEVVGTIDIGMTEVLDGDKIADVLMDFSNPSLTADLVAYVRRTKTAYLSGTTNLTEEQLDSIKALGDVIPCISTSNYSLGVALFKHVLGEVTRTLDGWDVEITETHHNKKVDAPSGTAKDLLKAVQDAREESGEVIYGREGECGARTADEIGMHSLRGGTVAGEHTVAYYGNDEIFEIKHTALSRKIFAEGAVKAAEKLVEMKPGFYTMEDILF